MPAIFLSRVLASALLGCGLAYYSLFSGRISGNPNSVFVAEVCVLLGLSLGPLWGYFATRPENPRERTIVERVACFFLYSSAWCIVGVIYGSTLTPPDPNPGDTLGGLVFGFLGAILGGMVGLYRAVANPTPNPEPGPGLSPGTR